MESQDENDSASECEKMEDVEDDHSKPDGGAESQSGYQESICDEPAEKKFKRGVVYVSYLPEGMRPTMLRDLISKFAPIGRIFLQRVEERGAGKRRKKGKGGASSTAEKYSEGWIEFMKKRHAKQVASLLNNQPMGTRKKDKFHDCLWNLKYLSKFKWIHLVERLNYEKAALKQRMQNEISQAKRVANFFKETVEREESRRKWSKKKGISIGNDAEVPASYAFAQRESRDDKTAKKTQIDGERQKFLKSLFS